MSFNFDRARPVAAGRPQPDPLGVSLRAALTDEAPDLANAALIIARIEYPQLDTRRSLQLLEALGARAAERLKDVNRHDVVARVTRLNRFVYGECGFAGNREWFSDVRNSLLNLVLERRVGIPITLALVYIEVARRAGVLVQGVAFPGHFLLRVPACQEEVLILDPFNGGAPMSDADCRLLLSTHVGDEARFDSGLLQPCSAAHMVGRLLNNLKRLYLQQRAYAYARRVTNLLLAIDPTMLAELRDRGLLSYHLDDFPAALRDLEDYLRLNAWTDGRDREEQQELQSHVSALRRRVVSLN